MTAAPTPRIALIHDFLLDMRGAERVFSVLCDVFPEADLFTAIHDRVGTGDHFAQRSVTTSRLQRLHPTRRTFRALLPWYPSAMEALDLRGYDLVVSSSSAWAHGVIVDETARHICYCHNPFRYAWNGQNDELDRRGAVTGAALRTVLHRWRQWDWIAAQRVDTYLANSETTQRRIERYFGRSSTVLYPPVQCDRFGISGVLDDAYVTLSHLMGHKHLDVAVRAFSASGRRLDVLGAGPEMRRLRRLAGPSVRFLGRLDDTEVAHRLGRAQALVVTATEEFGIAAVEAQAAGRPVIALRAGGLMETVIEGETGVFYERSEPELLAQVIAETDLRQFDPQRCRDNALRFDRVVFEDGIRRAVEDALGDRRLRLPSPGRGKGVFVRSGRSRRVAHPD